MVHRHSQAGARLRLDIAGYAERRREALRIYARRLAEKVVAEGGEIMLEPMNPADRKVVHDTVAEIDGVRSFSEGEDPERSVVIAPDDEDEGDAEARATDRRTPVRRAEGVPRGTGLNRGRESTDSSRPGSARRDLDGSGTRLRAS